MSPVSDAMAKTKLGLGSKGTVIVAVVAVAAIGIFIGRWSRGSSEPAVPAATPAPVASSPSAPVGAVPSGMQPHAVVDPGPQIFDTVEDPKWKAGVPMRDMDRDIFAQMQNPNLDYKLLTDLFPDKPYKVRLVGSVVERRYGLVMIDLDRDGKWDERWDLRLGQANRVVEHDPASDGQRGQYTLAHGKWQPH